MPPNLKKLFSFQVSVFVVLLSALFCSCKGHTEKSADTKTDSLEISNLLQKVYEWHDENMDKIHDYQMIANDSLFTSLDTVQLAYAVTELRKTNFFTTGFLQTYERIGRLIDNKLRHDTVKYYTGEINFPYEDADPWTFFQDDAGKYWETLKISQLKVDADSASLYWKAGDAPDTETYRVKMKREDNRWKISYLQGFDEKEY